MEFFRGSAVERFNRSCIALASLWLLVSVPLGIYLRPTVPDFEQFYMGGMIAARGEWDALYPVPHPGSFDNPGLRIHSDAKPKWKSLSREKRVWDHTHFMLPPPSALAFTPFSFVGYEQALWLWIAIEIACVLGVALIAADLLGGLLARPSRWQGGLVALIAFSPMTARAIRIANVSPVVALSLAMAIWSLKHEDRSSWGSLAFVFGAVLKYATLILAPLVIAARRWNTLFYAFAFGALALLVTMKIAGLGPFVEFYKEILPTLSRPSAFRGNQSLAGLLVRSYGRPLAAGIAAALNVARIASLLVLLGLMLTRSTRFWLKQANVLAAAAALLSWLLIFSPIAWEHWAIFLCPVWGWIIWEARDPGLRRVIATASLCLMYFPAGIFQVKGFARITVIVPEPWNSTQLAGFVLLLTLAFWRLLTPPLAAEGDSGHL